MDKMKQYLLLTVVGIVAVLAGGWFLLVSPQRAKVATLHDTADQAASQTQNLQLQLARLRAEAKTLPDDQKALAAIAAQLPPNPALPDLINDLTKAAARTGVDLQVIAPSPPQVFSGVSGTSGATSLPATGATGSTGSSGSSGAAAGAGSAAGGTLYQIPMSLTVVGTYFQLEQFENALEQLQRAFIPSVLDLAPGDPLGSGSATSSAAPAPAGAVGAYSGTLTAHITGSVFELQTTGSAATTTLPSGTGATAPATGTTSTSPAANK